MKHLSSFVCLLSVIALAMCAPAPENVDETQPAAAAGFIPQGRGVRPLEEQEESQSAVDPAAIQGGRRLAKRSYGYGGYGYGGYGYGYGWPYGYAYSHYNDWWPYYGHSYWGGYPYGGYGYGGYWW